MTVWKKVTHGGYIKVINLFTKLIMSGQAKIRIIPDFSARIESAVNI